MGNNEEMATRIVDFEAALADVRSSPTQDGSVELIAIRPAENQRQVVEEALLTTESGLAGDSWLEWASAKNEIYYETQLTLMNSRFAEAITQDGGWLGTGRRSALCRLRFECRQRSSGTRLEIGSATIEISAQPHTGCAKFSKRFGREVLMATRTDEGKRLRLRGVNARVLESGMVRRGDSVRRARVNDISG